MKTCLKFSIIAGLLSFICMKEILAQNIVGQVYYTRPCQTNCVETDPKLPMDSVRMEIRNANTGVFISNQITDSNGGYTENTSAGFVSITPEFEPYQNWDRGLNLYDVVTVQEHVNDINYINCPYRRIAADVDWNGIINTQDAELIIGVAVLDRDSFDNVPNWQFVPDAYTSSDPTLHDPQFAYDFWSPQAIDLAGNENPFKGIFNYTSYSNYGYNTNVSWVNRLHKWTTDINCSNWDFYAIKSGDVDGSAPPLCNAAPQPLVEFNFIPNNAKIFKKKKQVTFDIKVKSPIPIKGFQFALKMNNQKIKAMEVLNSKAMSSFQKDKNLFIKTKGNDNILRTLWINKNTDTDKIDFSNGLTLFSLKIKQAFSEVQDDFLSLDKDDFEIIFIDENKNKIPVEIIIETR